MPGYKLDIFVRKENVDRWDDRKTFITNLIDTRIGALDFVKGYFQEAFFQEGDQRIDLRDRIFREMIANVIIHREYTNALATEIGIYKDNVKATNPNIVHNRGPLDLVNFENFPKNPFIRKFFDNLGWSEEAGSGVRNITKYLKIYAKGAVPMFIEDNPFITIIPVKGHLLGDRSILLLDLFGIRQDSFDEKRAKLLKELPINPEVDKREDETEFINEFIGTLVKNEGKLVGFKILKKNILEKDKYKMGGTLRQIGGDLIIKKGRVLLTILTRMIVEMTFEEARLISGFVKKDTFRQNYLVILRNNLMTSLILFANRYFFLFLTGIIIPC